MNQLPANLPTETGAATHCGDMPAYLSAWLTDIDQHLSSVSASALEAGYLAVKARGGQPIRDIIQGES